MRVKSGLQRHDVIFSVDGRNTRNAPQVIDAIRKHAPGTVISLRINRGGTAFDINATLGAETIQAATSSGQEIWT